MFVVATRRTGMAGIEAQVSFERSRIAANWFVFM